MNALTAKCFKRGMHWQKYLIGITAGILVFAGSVYVQADTQGKSIGRTKAPAGAAVATPTGTPRPICEIAREARARNSPAAPGLEDQCRAAVAVVNALAAKGEAIANQDPLAIELRNREPEGPNRRGFDIGMAAAEGHTGPGEGKQRIHDNLSPEEQPGFDIAVAFSLERNRNARWAWKGAAIVARDPVLAEARSIDADVFYWLGFDIATGLFGDPALGADGSTDKCASIPLSAAGKRGFDAAKALQLRRSYGPESDRSPRCPWS